LYRGDLAVPQYRSAYHIVDQVGRPGIFRMTRTNAPYATVALAEAEFGALATWFDGVDPVEALLIDLRLATGRNDDAFEVAIRPRRRTLFRRFAHLGFLCASWTGKLQIERHGKEDRIPLKVFLDEDEALAWLDSC
jgi:hypothetical protein